MFDLWPICTLLLRLVAERMRVTIVAHAVTMPTQAGYYYKQNCYIDTHTIIIGLYVAQQNMCQNNKLYSENKKVFLKFI